MKTENSKLARTSRITLAGLAVNLLLSVGKLAGGILASSHALLADGVHSFSDCCTDMAILVGVRYWTKPEDADHPHGHARIETIITGFIALFIIATGSFIGIESFDSVLHPASEPPGLLALLIALSAILLKGGLSAWTLKLGRELRSSALVANSMHQRSDVLSSVPVALVILIARIHRNLLILDGIGGLIVSLIVIRMGFSILRPVLWKLSDTAAPSEIIAELRELALSVPGVLDVHALRTRYQGEGIQADMHIVVDSAMTVGEAFGIVKTVEDRLRSSGPGVVDVMVRLEPGGS